MAVNLLKQLQECQEKTKILEEREDYLTNELRRIVDIYIYQKQTSRDQIFVSYSHKDVKWLLRLKTVLGPIIKGDVVNLWDDSMIRPGEQWCEKIQATLRRAKVVVLLVSYDFLSSEFVLNDELPSLLESERKFGTRLIWFPVKASLVEQTPIINYQAATDPKKPLNSMKTYEQERALVQIARVIKEAYDA